MVVVGIVPRVAAAPAARSLSVGWCRSSSFANPTHRVRSSSIYTRLYTQAKADVNKTTKDGVWGPLRICAHHGMHHAILTLLALKANVASIDSAIPLASKPSLIQALEAAKRAALSSTHKA